MTKTFPVARGATDAAVYDEVLGALGDFGIKVVNKAAQSGFLLPAFAPERVAARGAKSGTR